MSSIYIHVALLRRHPYASVYTYNSHHSNQDSLHWSSPFDKQTPIVLSQMLASAMYLYWYCLCVLVKGYWQSFCNPSYVRLKLVQFYTIYRSHSTVRTFVDTPYLIFKEYIYMCTCTWYITVRLTCTYIYMYTVHIIMSSIIEKVHTMTISCCHVYMCEIVYCILHCIVQIP
jgi:hypothetical protein